VNYDPITNTVSVNYTGCDICLLGNADAVRTCECRLDCESDRQECFDECKDNFSGLTDLVNCIENCQDRNNCLNECGPEPEPIREIISFGYRLVAAWDVIPFDPRFDQSQWEVFDSETIESNNVIIPNWNPPSPWPKVHSGNNTCYGIGIRIFYQEPDGSIGFCDFTEWNCNIIG